MNEDKLRELTPLLHDVGIVVWHDVPKLRNIVVINPQWLADAMAGVVSFMSLGAAAQQGGMINWGRMQDTLKLKYASQFLNVALPHLY